MNRINPGLFAAAFTAWVRATWPERPEFVAIDARPRGAAMTARPARRRYISSRGHGAHNMAVVRHFALNLVRSAPDLPPPARSPLKRGPKPGSKPKAMSLKRRRKMAGWNSAYMQTVLGAKTR